MKSYLLKTLILSVILGILMPVISLAQTNTTNICAQIETRKKDQLEKVSQGKKVITAKEAKVLSQIEGRTYTLIASTTATQVTQENIVKDVLVELEMIAETDEEKLVATTTSSLLLQALSLREASTTEVLASFSSQIEAAKTLRAQLVEESILLYEQDVVDAFEEALLACASETKNKTVLVQLEQALRSARANLQRMEQKLKAVSETTELTFSEARLTIQKYDGLFTKVLKESKENIAETFYKEEVTD